MNYGIILAAGNGVRLGIKDPIKPLVLVKNKPIFLHSLIVFTQNKNIDEIVLVVNKKYHNQYLKYLTKFVKPIHVVDGSNVARHLSLSLAVQFFQNEKHLQSNDVIVTHDAARINVSNELINLSIQVAKKYGCASTVLPLYDSLCEINNKSVYLDRANKYLVQTPQTFQFKYWKNVSSSRTTTDLFTYLNLQVTKRNLVIGSWNNFKITNKKDLENL